MSEDLTYWEEQEIWTIACKKGIDVGRARVIWEEEKLWKKRVKDAQKRIIDAQKQQEEEEAKKLEIEERIKAQRIALEESYAELASELEEEAKEKLAQTVEKQIRELNSRKIKLDLKFSEETQRNFDKFLKPIAEALSVLSTGEANEVVLSFYRTENNKVKMVVRYG